MGWLAVCRLYWARNKKLIVYGLNFKFSWKLWAEWSNWHGTARSFSLIHVYALNTMFFPAGLFSYYVYSNLAQLKLSKTVIISCSKFWLISTIETRAGIFYLRCVEICGKTTSKVSKYLLVHTTNSRISYWFSSWHILTLLLVSLCLQHTIGHYMTTIGNSTVVKIKSPFKDIPAKVENLPSTKHK